MIVEKTDQIINLDLLAGAERHKTVMPHEVLEAFAPAAGKLFLDATFGCGGHTERILKSNPDCSVIAFDWDIEALNTYGLALKEIYGERLTLVWSSFGNLYKMFKKLNISLVDGILADFGTSQVQIKNKDGFSFNENTPLDMRMSPAHNSLTAEYIVNRYEPKELADIFFHLGGEKNSRIYAAAIATARAERKITTTRQLAELIEKSTPRADRRMGVVRTHPATRVFQALRIYVNKELEQIEQFLKIAPSFLKQDAPVICISFHSLEDRLVKQYFTEFERMDMLHGGRSVILPSEFEIATNPSSRSAKMRCARRTSNKCF